MMRDRWQALAASAVLGLSGIAAAHEGDILVVLDIDFNELRLGGYDFADPIPADFLIPGEPGWWGNSINIEEGLNGIPGDGLFPIEQGTQIFMVFHAWDAALSMRPDGELGTVYDQPGQELYLGEGWSGFGMTPWWYVDSTHPAYDPNKTQYAVDVSVYDQTGTHQPSPVYTILIEVQVSACVADMTGSSNPDDPAYGLPNGVLDADDFFYFLDQFAAGNAARADLTGSGDPNDPGYGVPDGDIDGDDFFFFLDVFSGGCR